MAVTVRHVMEVLETIAPSSLAEAWDNIGLQVGHHAWPVDKIWVALEPNVDLVARASVHGVNLLVAHHPLIYHPLSAVDLETPVGRIIEVALQNRLAIFCAHTNLDSAMGGVNDMLAEKLELRDTLAVRTKKTDHCKLVVFVPAGYEEQILDVLFESGAGKGERYTHVSFRTQGVGTFRAGVMAKPFLGRMGEVTHTPEYRIEAVVAKQELSKVINALNRVHPYEEVACDVYAVEGGSPKEGLGRIGNLAKEISLEDLARRIKEVLQLDTIKIVGDRKQTIKRVAVCSGSGKSLVNDFLASDAQAYVSGDLGYHEGRSVEASGRALIDIGHFASEHLVVQSLAARLKEALSKKEYFVQVEAYTEETDCFQYI